MTISTSSPATALRFLIFSFYLLHNRLLVNYRKLGLMVLLCSVLYGEFLCHLAAYWRWPQLPPAKDGWRRVLLVADPQLVGLRDEPPWPVGAITRWDADRYLASTFRWALRHAGGPADAVVFLGDLLDEGSATAYGPDYRGYVERFRAIYPASSAGRLVFVSGDNDVGGEGGDPVTGAKVDRFRSFFPEARATEVSSSPKGGGRMRVVVHNAITAALDEADPDWEVDDGGGGADKEKERKYKGITILASHVPVLSSFMTYVPAFQKLFLYYNCITTFLHFSSDHTRRVLDRFRPDVIFSAHVHRGIAASLRRAEGGDSPSEMRRPVVNRTDFFRPETESPVELDVSSDRRSGVLREIVVPASSYRMGERHMAIGVASFRQDEGGGGGGGVRMVYSNLWLAERFPVLFVYAASAVLALVLACCCPKKRRSASGRRMSSSSADKRV